MYRSKPKKNSFFVIIIVVLLIILLHQKNPFFKKESKIDRFLAEAEKNLPDIIFSQQPLKLVSSDDTYIETSFPLKCAPVCGEKNYTVKENEQNTEIVLDSSDPFKLKIICVKMDLTAHKNLEKFSKHFTFNGMKYMLESKNLKKMDASLRAFRSGFIPKNIGYGILRNSTLSKSFLGTINGKSSLMFLCTSNTLNMYHIFLWNEPTDTHYYLVEIITTLDEDAEILSQLISSLKIQ